MQFIVTLICNLPSIILALLGLGFLIAFHELGHLLFAKLFNVFAPSFSIGFGPKLLQKKIGETIYTLSAIPLGGYVELAGAQEVGQGEQKHAFAKDERAFNQKPYWQKMIIIGGGILFNLIFAYASFVFLFYSGAPCVGTWCKNYKPLVETVTPNSAASRAGIKSGDIIILLNEENVSTIGHVTNYLEAAEKLPNSITIQRDGQNKTLTLTPQNLNETEIRATEKKPAPTLKLGLFWKIEPQSITKSFQLAYEATWAIISQILQALKGITKKEAGLGGPLMLITVITQCVTMGYKIFIFMLAFISINLAVFNVIPLPIFDGGQALFYSIEAFSGKPLSDKTRYIIHYITWIFVILLIVYLTYSDVITLYTTPRI